MRYFFISMSHSESKQLVRSRSYSGILHCYILLLRVSLATILTEMLQWLHPKSACPAGPGLSPENNALARLLHSEKKYRHWHAYKVSFPTDTGHFDRHILAGNKVAGFPKCLLLHLITQGEEQHLFFLLAHNLLVLWVWHKMTAVNTAGHLLAFQWWLY